MAVENKYVDANIAAEKKTSPAFNEGEKIYCQAVTFEVAAADDDGSIFRVVKNINEDLIPFKIDIFNDAITGGTDYDLGFYEPLEEGTGGVVIDKDALVDGASMATARTRTTGPLDGLLAVDIVNAQKRIYELAGQTLTTKKKGYDLAFTANTVGTVAGTITLLGMFLQG